MISSPAITLAPAPTAALTAAIYAAGCHLPTDFAERLELLGQRRRILDLAHALLDLADAFDGDADLEPDDDGEQDNEDCCAAADDDPVSQPARQSRNDFGAGDAEDGEAEPDEASLQPLTLSPARRPARVVRRPQRRAA